jgi:hypothetical protein
LGIESKEKFGEEGKLFDRAKFTTYGEAPNIALFEPPSSSRLNPKLN